MKYLNFVKRDFIIFSIVKNYADVKYMKYTLFLK